MCVGVCMYVIGVLFDKIVPQTNQQQAGKTSELAQMPCIYAM